MKKLFALLLALVMSLSLVACGGSDTSSDAASGVDTQPVFDAFNSAADAFDAVANEINADLEAYPQELIDVMNEMADAMLEAKALLESGDELTEEVAADLMDKFNEVEVWSDDVAANLENMTIEATTVDTSKEAVIEAFNYVSTRFDAVSAIINEDIESYDEEFVDGMIEVAEGMIDFKEILESDAELTEEEGMTILETLLEIDEWIDSTGLLEDVG